MTLRELQKLRAELIVAGQDGIPGMANRAQQVIYQAIVDQIINQLEVSQGNIISNKNNLLLITSMDSVFDAFRRKQLFDFANKIIRDMAKLKNLNKQYFGIIRQDETHQEVVSESSRRSTQFNFSTGAGWTDVVATVNQLLDKSLGVTAAGNIRRDGFLDKFVNNNRVRNEMKSLAVAAIRREMPLRQFNKTIKDNILGRPGVSGKVNQYYRQAAFDLYQQNDRLLQKKFAQNLSLKAFVYSGVRIETSRAFCVKRKGKVFLVKETADWKNDPDLPKQNGGTRGYDPLIDLGWFNCIDHTNFVTDARAIQLRPDLEGQL